MLLTTDNENLIIEYTKKHNCRQSGIDAGSGTLGVSVYDHLQLVSDIKRKIVAMNNRQISINQEDGKQRLYNEDMHDNMRAMGERGELHLTTATTSRHHSVLCGGIRFKIRTDSGKLRFRGRIPTL